LGLVLIPLPNLKIPDVNVVTIFREMDGEAAP
jgi:hypothetical protein